MTPEPSTNKYKPISDYGLIGNCQSAALVGLDGSIDWCCFPRFDSPSVFAAILDHEKGGHFAINPRNQYSSTQRYLGETNVLETRFLTHEGVCTLTDFMPLYLREGEVASSLHQITRIVKCEEGSVELDVEYAPRPDYARSMVNLRAQDKIILYKDDRCALGLSGPIALRIAGDKALGSFTMAHGEQAVFTLSYGDSSVGPSSDGLNPEQLLNLTENYWRTKVDDLDYDGLWRDQVVRSYLVLHLLTYLPTGGIVAAPTTSLPEEIGGVRNWDYRYTWLRDASFTIDALIALGHQEEAKDFFGWLSRICDTGGPDIRIMYGIAGEKDLTEEELDHLEGYRSSRPVRIGNGAAGQLQHDVYGEVLASAYSMAVSGTQINDLQWEMLAVLADMAVTRWREPDSGIWEVRGGPFHFVHSKAMCWVALDRAIKLAGLTGREGARSERWKREAGIIKGAVLERGWSEKKHAFTQHFGTETIDASALLLPIIGFLPNEDPRVVSTIRRIRQELGNGPFVHRYRPEETDDGLVGTEGAFAMCSFWLVQALARLGQKGEARSIFERMLKSSNHLGLFSEMIDPYSGIALGNFPQAFTHIGLIQAARECGIDD